MQINCWLFTYLFFYYCVLQSDLLIYYLQNLFIGADVVAFLLQKETITQQKKVADELEQLLAEERKVCFALFDFTWWFGWLDEVVKLWNYDWTAMAKREASAWDEKPCIGEVDRFKE